MKPLVFIGCGQVTAEEVALGKLLHDIVLADGRLEPYFAENQSSLEGVTANILTKLSEAAAFVAVIHPRGMVHLAHGSGAESIVTRASVWIEQEIAILATLAQVYRRAVAVQLYVKRGVVREGLRTFVMANPFEFTVEDEVVAHFRQTLASWDLRLGSRTVAAAEEELLARMADVGEAEVQRKEKHGSFVRIAGRDFVDQSDRAVAAKFVEAVGTLQQNGLLREVAPGKFELTAAGFERARTLSRDLGWLIIRPVVQFWWPARAGEPAKLNVFLRNVGFLIPRVIEMQVLVPWPYLEQGVSGTAFAHGQFAVQISGDEAAAIRPGEFETRVINQRPRLQIPLWLPTVRARNAITDEIEIRVRAENAEPTLYRFAIGQLFDQSQAAYCAVREPEPGQPSQLAEL